MKYTKLFTKGRKAEKLLGSTVVLFGRVGKSASSTIFRKISINYRFSCL